MSRSARRAELTREGKRPLPDKGTAHRRVILFKEWKEELLTPGEPRKIITHRKLLHVTKGFRYESKTAIA